MKEGVWLFLDNTLLTAVAFIVKECSKQTTRRKGLIFRDFELCNGEISEWIQKQKGKGHGW